MARSALSTLQKNKATAKRSKPTTALGRKTKRRRLGKLNKSIGKALHAAKRRK